jgi:hypothetical protein
MNNPKAKQRAEAIGSLMVEYFTAYLTNPNCVLNDIDQANQALLTCNQLAQNSLTLAEADYRRENNPATSSITEPVMN